MAVENQSSVPLFFPEKNADRHPRKTKIFTELIFQIVFIGKFDIIRKIAEKGKGGNSRR